MTDVFFSRYMEKIEILPITVDAFDEYELWRKELESVGEQYLSIIRREGFRAFEWGTNIRNIFHRSTKPGKDWQLSFITKGGLALGDFQYQDKDIGGNGYSDPLNEFPFSEPQKKIIIKALFQKTYRQEFTHGEESKDGGERMVDEKVESQDDLKKPTVKDKIMEQLEEGIKKTMDSTEFANWCQTQGSFYFSNYSFKNAMLTYMQNPEASYVRGYEAWKEYGRQVRQGSSSIKILAPVFAREYGAKGSLLSSIIKSCDAQMKKDPSQEYATYRLGQSKLSFLMYKNRLFDIKINDKVVKPHITAIELRKFIDNSVIGKIPIRYDVSNVFDISDVTEKVEFLWVNKNTCKREEMELDQDGKPITNSRGQVKIKNSDERRARFQTTLDLSIKEHDTGKMQILYEVLQEISKRKGIPISESYPGMDEVLKSAKGYYRHPTEDYPMGYIVINSDLSLTQKVSVAFHVMAHSDMHRDLESLKAEMDQVDNVTKQMREIQAEAVAYMAASAFGIETEHKSFAYIAQWSEGRELKSLENSLSVIYKESQKLLRDVEQELDSIGLTMAFETKDKTPMTKEEIAHVVTEHKKFLLNHSRDNESMQKLSFTNYQSFDTPEQQVIFQEQIALTKQVEDKLMEYNHMVERLEQSSDRDEQIKLQYQIRAANSKTRELLNKYEDLSNEHSKVMGESTRNRGLRQVYYENRIMAIGQLHDMYPQLHGLSEKELAYLVKSEFIASNYSKHLEKDNCKFVELSLKQAENFKNVLSKNQVVVEVISCENEWLDNPIFESGSMVHPKEANKRVSDAEVQIKKLKEQAEKQGEYFPYIKCNMIIYAGTKDGKLDALLTRVDIGDGNQKSLIDHLKEVCRDSGRQELLDNFIKSTRERSNILYLIPQQDIDEIEASFQGKEINTTRPMVDWKKDIESSQHVSKNLNVEQQMNRGENIC